MPFSGDEARRGYSVLLVTGLLSLFLVVTFRFYPVDFVQAPFTLDNNGTEAHPVELTVDEGRTTPYGMTMSQESIPTLLEYQENIKLTPRQEQALGESLDIESPCCGGRVFSCGCEHDRALQGLGKMLISSYGYSPQMVRAEAILWQRYFFPEYFADKRT